MVELSSSQILKVLQGYFAYGREDVERPYLGPVSEEEVSEAERELGIVFPLSYRIFLLNFGAARLGLLEIFGIVSPMQEKHIYEFTEVISSTLDWRESTIDVEALPRDSIFVATDAGEINICIDGGDRPIVARSVSLPPSIIEADFLDVLERFTQEPCPYGEFRS